jgi:hypothetical protein
MNVETLGGGMIGIDNWIQYIPRTYRPTLSFMLTNQITDNFGFIMERSAILSILGLCLWGPGSGESARGTFSVKA